MNPMGYEPSEFLHRMQTSAVYNVAVRTPLESLPRVSRVLARPVLVKREDLQPVHSFKLRGAYQRMAGLPFDRLMGGVVAASAGNHAQGVALAAKALGTRATIVVPTPTPEIKRQAILELDAELIVTGDSFDDAYAFALKLSQDTDREFIHPFNDADVIVGQGTAGVEIVEAYPGEIEAVFIPVGGGGFIAGVALAVKQLRPGVKVIGVEVEDSAAMTHSLEQGGLVTLEKMGMFADGCAVRRVGDLTFALAQKWVDEMVLVTNDEVCSAIRTIFQERRVLVEPAGAMGLAGLLKWGEKSQTSSSPAGALITVLSGANLNFDRLQFIAERTKTGAHAEAILAITIPEVPGAFRKLCRAIGSRAITEFNYRFGDQSKACVFVGIAVSGLADCERVKGDLVDACFEFVDLTDDEVAKLHVRHMVGGRSSQATYERIFRVEFPERSGALADFLDQLDARWNISLFHYRNHGADRGRALIGFQVPPASSNSFEEFISAVGVQTEEETLNPAVKHFLGG